MKANSLIPNLVGMVYMEGHQYVVVDLSGIPFPQEDVAKILPGITQEEYENREAEALKQKKVDAQAVEPRYSSGPKKVQGSIYAVVVGDRIKIGKTKNLKTLLRTYERAFNNYRLIESFTSEDYSHAEEIALKRFGGQAQHNEWLEYTDKLEEDVKEYFLKERLGF